MLNFNAGTFMSLKWLFSEVNFSLPYCPNEHLSPIFSPLPDERDAIQKKTFTKWVNKHLKKVRTGQGFLKNDFG